MTPDQIKILTALSRATFFPGSTTKRLVQNLAGIAERNPDHKLTDKQHAAIVDIAIKYRRQIPADVVAIARELKGDRE